MSTVIDTTGLEGKRKRRVQAKGRVDDPRPLAEVRALLGDAPRRRDLLIEYLHRKSAGLFYFCLNPYSDDTGGLLKKDFLTPETQKLKLLSVARSTRIFWTGMPPSSPPSPPPVPPSPPPPGLRPGARGDLPDV